MEKGEGEKIIERPDIPGRRERSPGEIESIASNLEWKAKTLGVLVLSSREWATFVLFRKHYNKESPCLIHEVVIVLLELGNLLLTDRLQVVIEGMSPDDLDQVLNRVQDFNILALYERERNNRTETNTQRRAIGMGRSIETLQSKVALDLFFVDRQSHDQATI